MIMFAVGVALGSLLCVVYRLGEIARIQDRQCEYLMRIAYALERANYHRGQQ